MNFDHGPANHTFSGHDVVGGPDKGTATYTDSQGSWSGKATDVTVNSMFAIMTVEVTSSTHPLVPVGSTHMYTLYDNGEGEAGTGDYFTYANGTHQYMADAENIQVHYSS